MRTQPCPASTTFSVPLNTTQLAEGSHSIALKAFDFAGRSTPLTAATRTIVVDNVSAPTAEQRPMVSGTPATGSSLATSDARWNPTV